MSQQFALPETKAVCTEHNDKFELNFMECRKIQLTKQVTLVAVMFQSLLIQIEFIHQNNINKVRKKTRKLTCRYLTLIEEICLKYEATS